MQGLNSVHLLGNLGAAPELRVTQSGQAVLNMRLAINESYLDKDKVRRERVEWVSVTVWGRRAEALGKILTKGSGMFIEGSLRSSSYEDRDGKKVWKTEIVARNVLLTGKGSGHADEGADPPPRASKSSSGGSRGAAPAATGGVAYPGVKSAGDFEIRFGNDAGKRISEVEDLSWLRGALVKSIGDPKKAQYADQNRGQVNAIDELLARRAGGGLAASGGGEAPAGDDYGEGSYGSVDDGDIPFATCDAAYEQPWMAHKPRRYGMT